MIRLHRTAYTTLLAALTTATTLAPLAAAHADDHDHDRGKWDDKRPAIQRERREEKKEIKDDVRDIQRDKIRLEQDRRELRQDQRDRDRDQAWRRDHDRAPDWNHRPDWDRRPDNFRDRIQDARQEADHRQDTKNQWRNLGYVGAAAAVYGLLKHDPTITFIGAAGALYSASRYDQDRKSQDEMTRARYQLFERGWFERDGVRYNRREVWRDGQKYYYFSR